MINDVNMNAMMWLDTRLWAMRTGWNRMEKSAGVNLERFEITQPTLSHHMKILVGCGLVNDRKEGNGITIL